MTAGLRERGRWKNTYTNPVSNPGFSAYRTTVDGGQPRRDSPTNHPHHPRIITQVTDWDLQCDSSGRRVGYMLQYTSFSFTVSASTVRTARHWISAPPLPHRAKASASIFSPSGGSQKFRDHLVFAGQWGFELVASGWNESLCVDWNSGVPPCPQSMGSSTRDRSWASVQQGW